MNLPEHQRRAAVAERERLAQPLDDDSALRWLMGQVVRRKVVKRCGALTASAGRELSEQSQSELGVPAFRLRQNLARVCMGFRCRYGGRLWRPGGQVGRRCRRGFLCIAD